MEEKEMNPAESLALIGSVLATAKNKLADDGTLIIFWGWLVFIAALINYAGILIHWQGVYYVWPVLMPLGGIFSLIYSRMRTKKEGVNTYVESYLGFAWLAFIIGLAISLGFMWVHGVKTTYFFIMLLYGMATLVSGGILRFKPLIAGSFFSFAMAIVSVFAGYKEQFLCLAAALLFSYIIPGHLLRIQYKSQEHV